VIAARKTITFVDEVFREVKRRITTRDSSSSRSGTAPTVRITSVTAKSPTKFDGDPDSGDRS
jgi:hypothetical protein